MTKERVSRRGYLRYAGAAVFVGAAAAAGYGIYEMSKPTVTPTPTQTVTPTPKPTKLSIAVYAYAATNVVVFWDPSENSTYSNEVVVMNNVYEQLVRYDPLQDKYVPVLSSDWKVSEDGLTYDFNLRRGVKFHCGHDFDANSVKYSIERNLRGWDGGGPKGASHIWSPVKEIKVIDDHTVRFALQYPAALLNVASAAYCAHMYCAKCTEQYGHEWFYEGHDLGTGPYLIEKWDKELDQVTLAKFEDYWGGWAGKHFDKAVIKSVPEWAKARLQLEAGDADIVNRVPFEDVEALERVQGIETVRTPAYQNMLGFFNTKKPPLDDNLVRQAISYAVPYQDIVNYVMHGNARQSRGPVPYGIWGHGEEVFQYTYDLTKAKELLAKAGYPKGGFSLLYTYNAGDEYERRSGELLKAELAKLEIILELRGMPLEEQSSVATAKKPEDRQDIFVTYWWPDYPDPYTFLRPMFHSEENIVFNFGYYSNPEYDKLIDEASAIAGTDREKALSMYIEAQQKLIEDAPSIFFFDQEYARAKRTALRGYVDNPAYANVVFWYNCYRE